MTTFEPTDKVIKIVPKDPQLEAIYFDGSDDSVLRIAAWVNTYGGVTRYITDGPRIAPKYLSISSDGSWEWDSRTTILPGSWIVLDQNEKFVRYSDKSMAAEFNIVTEPEEVNSGPGWYEFIHPSKATTHIVHVFEGGELYLEDGVTPDDFTLAAANGRAYRLVRAEDIQSHPISMDGKTRIEDKEEGK